MEQAKLRSQTYVESEPRFDVAAISKAEGIEIYKIDDYPQGPGALR